MKLFSHRRQAVHLGPYPLGRLAWAELPVVPAPGSGPRRDVRCTPAEMILRQALAWAHGRGPEELRRAGAVR